MARSPKGKRRRSSGSERIFEDESHRIWSAGQTPIREGVGAVVFTCLSDSREAIRAVVLDEEMPLMEAGSEKLRTLLEMAPRLGRL